MKKFKNITKKKKSTPRGIHHTVTKKKVKVSNEAHEALPIISTEPSPQATVTQDLNTSLPSTPQNPPVFVTDSNVQVTAQSPQSETQPETTSHMGPTEKITNELIAQLKKTEA